MRVSIMAAFFFVAPIQAKRSVRVSQHRSRPKQDSNATFLVSEQDSGTSPALPNLAKFIDWTKNNAAKGFIGILKPLIQGVSDAKYLDRIEWSGSDSPTLKFSLNVDHLYGEMASNSRVPIMWTLAREVTFKFLPPAFTTVLVRGLGTQTSAQAMELYEDVLKSCGGKCNPTTCTGSYGSIPACVQHERDAAAKFLDDNWSKKKKIKSKTKKITEVLKTSYGSTIIYYGAKAKNPSVWGNVFYNLIVGGGSTIQSFELIGAGQVAASTIPVETDNAKLYNMVNKSKTMSLQTLRNNAGNMGFAKSVARSGVNLALMIAYGDSARRKVMQELKVPAGDIDAIGNILTLCREKSLSNCKGKKVIGRLKWTTDVPSTMN